MRGKKLIIFIAIGIIAIIEIGMYWNAHLYYKATEKIEDNEKKVSTLNKANRFYPSNDLVYNELGKAYFDLGMKNIQNQELRDAYLQKSIQSFTRSLKINPASIFGHFNFAQSLLYMSFAVPSFEVNYYDEFKKSALLTGHHSSIYYEVGKIFFSRWPELSDDDKKFTIELLNKIASKKIEEEIQAIMQVWAMNVNDYEVMEKILPQDPGIYRMYAQFLGEKSLSPEARQNFLAQAEFLDYERAVKAFNQGQSDFQYYRLQDASSNYGSCLQILQGLRFYQNLTARKMINASEYENFLRLTLLNYAKTLIEQGKTLKEVEGYLRSYLDLEKEVALINDLDAYLRGRGLIKEKLEESFNDLGLFSFQMFLNFKQNRYREIMKAGTYLQQSFVVIPEVGKKDYIKILQLMADAYQKVDYIYDAREFYKKALEVDPGNLDGLLKYRQNCVRFNDEPKIKEIDRKVLEIITPAEVVMGNTAIGKGRAFTRAFTFDGRNIAMTIHFYNSEPEISPLVSILFNGRVIWENYLEGEQGEATVSFLLSPQVGQNTLQVIPVNREITLTKITYSISGDAP